MIVFHCMCDDENKYGFISILCDSSLYLNMVLFLFCVINHCTCDDENKYSFISILCDSSL